jgi:hypothetical protein
MQSSKGGGSLGPRWMISLYLARQERRVHPAGLARSPCPGVVEHERVCHLNLELQRVVTNIRKLPGLSRSLLPSFFLRSSPWGTRHYCQCEQA